METAFRIIPLAVALALDAFGVGLGIACGRELDRSKKKRLIISFAFFQLLFSLTGALIGRYIDANLFNITGYLSGSIILFLGILLILEGYKEDNSYIYAELTIWLYIILGISVSIDALGVGFSLLYNYQLVVITINSLVIGLVTAGLTGLSLLLTSYLKNFCLINNYADYIGGVILIIFGLQMLL